MYLFVGSGFDFMPKAVTDLFGLAMIDTSHGTAFEGGTAGATAGLITFVGLVVPHAIRLAAGPDHRFLLPASALLGAALLVTADILARCVVAPAELPIGILTALLGAPFFLWLLLRLKAVWQP